MSLHVSPCGWYCFQAPDDQRWLLEDTPEQTLMRSRDGECSIEISAARKQSTVVDVDVSQIHETFLRHEKLDPLQTKVFENPCRVGAYVTKGWGPDEMLWLVTHAYWSRYCVFIQFRGPKSTGSEDLTQAFYDIVHSLQPLVED